MTKSIFDKKVHIRNSKTGRITEVRAYRLHVSKDKGELYEREGKFFYPDGTPVEKMQAEVSVSEKQKKITTEVIGEQKK